MSKKETRKERDSRLRENERERLLETYRDGISNVDWSRADWDCLWSGDVGKKIPRITKAEWLERELTKYDNERPTVPSHKVQDPEERVVKYRREFIECAKAAQPEAFEELRVLVPAFDSLFSRKIEKDYIKILNDLKLKLFGYRLTYGVESFDRKWDSDYVWGELLTTFYYAKIMPYIGKSEFDDIFGSKDKAIIEVYQHTLNAFTRTIKKNFEATADGQAEIPRTFLNLQLAIYGWIEKHHLKKDWLVDYAYYFLFQLSENPGVLVKDIEVATRNYNCRTMYRRFEFETQGWWASEHGENVKQFEKRVTKEFELARDRYVLEASSALSLDKLIKFTKPPSFENVEWLVYRVLKGWDAERIVEKFFPRIAADRTQSPRAAKSFRSKKAHVENEIRELKKYGLPYRNLVN